MKIGIDYHGVINSNPTFFKTFNQLAIEKGIEIVILSGAQSVDVEKYLVEKNIPYTSVWSLLDYFKTKNLVTFYEDGSFFVPNEIWNRAKATYCKKEKIDVLIDDSILYGSYFQTPFCLYSMSQKKCTLIKKNIPIDFSLSAEKVLENLINALEKKSVQNK